MTRLTRLLMAGLVATTMVLATVGGAGATTGDADGDLLTQSMVFHAPPRPTPVADR